MTKNIFGMELDPSVNPAGQPWLAIPGISLGNIASGLGAASAAFFNFIKPVTAALSGPLFKPVATTFGKQVVAGTALAGSIAGFQQLSGYSAPLTREMAAITGGGIVGAAIKGPKGSLVGAAGVAIPILLGKLTEAPAAISAQIKKAEATITEHPLEAIGIGAGVAASAALAYAALKKETEPKVLSLEEIIQKHLKLQEEQGAAQWAAIQEQLKAKPIIPESPQPITLKATTPKKKRGQRRNPRKRRKNLPKRRRLNRGRKKRRARASHHK